ncbi:TetR/AcrR family transcriptional regulator [Gordonia sp. KTR9]|uniref:TetR/AcrR family transcriptional regulator n=1 Tax=Gordonia sp. KTR9 TaxID=337191 RepID=UPI00027DDF42|nr:TetR/AcrR family transcriptional regulator [Gordonia sp. KTR9]AFR49482.1 Transcriptional regulator [Gordonia sp. KTR9]
MPNPDHIAGLRIDPNPVASARPRRSATRSRIAEAAAQIFAEVGFADTTMEAVAERADVSARTVYRHFGSKGALLAAGFAVRISNCLARVSVLLDSGMDLRSSLESAVRAGFLDQSEHTGGLVATAAGEGELWAQWLWAAHRQHNVLARLLCRADGRPAEEATSPVWQFRAGALLNAFVTAHELWIRHPGQRELRDLLVETIETMMPILSSSEPLAPPMNGLC